MDKFVRVSDVIDWFRAYGHMDEHIPFEVLVTDLRDNSIPAADAAPVVHGQWLSCFEDWRMQIEGDKCSVCGFEHCGTPKGEFKFCPNCGAKMDGGTTP